MRVFISHSSKDKPLVEHLARALTERGFEVWLDKWEINAGDDIVAAINTGLDHADAGIIAFSKHSQDSRWLDAEIGYLTFARIEESKPLIPVMIGADAFVPPLLRPLARRRIDEVDAIYDALLRRKAHPGRHAVRSQHGMVRRLLIKLHPVASPGVQVDVFLDDQPLASVLYPRLPAALITAQGDFLRGFGAGSTRDPAGAQRHAMESSTANLGRLLGTFCLPAPSAAAVVDLLEGSRKFGVAIEICVEADGAHLLGLPFEALRLPNDQLVTQYPSVVMWRRPAGLKWQAQAPLPGPLKILVAVAAPYEEKNNAPVLDHERELQNILDAVEPMNRLDNAQVRILEVGHPEQIAAALAVDAYHVLHLSCHGQPGNLQMENEEGEPVLVTAAELVAPLLPLHRQMPLVLLSSCHGGSQDTDASSFAEALLRSGVPAVVAMQTSVSDGYATGLARSFYEHLLQGEHLRPSRALAAARKHLEQLRLKAIHGSGDVMATQPEYATATLFVAGDEAPLADFAVNKQPLSTRPIYEVSGSVPQLRMGDLIGRRRELRETLRVLRDSSRQHAGVVLTGIGGVGKSALAGRAMQRLQEQGWKLAVCTGRYDFGAIATALAQALLGVADPQARVLANQLGAANVNDVLRVAMVHKVLAEYPVLLVLDDFEQNLSVGGDSFLNPDVNSALQALMANARKGRVLMTCRHPVPGLQRWLQRIGLGALSRAEIRKLALRLPALQALQPSELSRVLWLIGGHPRMLEFLDALVRGGEARLLHATHKLDELLQQHPLELATQGDLDQSIRATVLLGARNILLDELLQLCRAANAEQSLLQIAVSNIPVSAAGLARMLAADPADEGDLPAAQRAINRLEDLSLLHRLPDGTASVHRWTAEGLKAGASEEEHRARCLRAGRYRWWCVANESHDYGDAVEALRNFLAAGSFDEATAVAGACFDVLRRAQQSIAVAALAAEILETLPESHADFSMVADTEAEAHLALGESSRAMARYQALLEHHERLAQAEPARADYQRDLSVSYNKMGELYRALGEGERAREAFLKSLSIRERVAQAEPARADYQRDLVISLIRVATSEGEAGDDHLQRAWTLLNELSTTGRLDKADERMIPVLQQLLAERGLAGKR